VSCARIARAAPHHDADHLVGDVERGLEAVAFRERETHVHRDQHVHAHRACEADRQVVHQAAIHQHPPADLHRGQEARRRHARAQHGREIARAQHHRLAGLEVGGERTERDRQAVEVLHFRDAQRGGTQCLRDLLALHQAERQHHALPLAEAERALGEDAAVVLLAAEHEVAAWRTVAQQFLPVELAEGGLDLVAAQARGIQTAHDGTHAGAGHGVDRNPHLLEGANDADVGGAARPAAAQHQPDARAFAVGRRDLVCMRC
jgi:hypothetical protein